MERLTKCILFFFHSSLAIVGTWHVQRALPFFIFFFFFKRFRISIYEKEELRNTSEKTTKQNKKKQPSDTHSLTANTIISLFGYVPQYYGSFVLSKTLSVSGKSWCCCHSSRFDCFLCFINWDTVLISINFFFLLEFIPTNCNCCITIVQCNQNVFKLGWALECWMELMNRRQKKMGELFGNCG